MSKKKTTEEFIEESRALHGDKYDYSKAVYVNSHTKICIIDPLYGEFLQTPNRHLCGRGSPYRHYDCLKGNKRGIKSIEYNTNKFIEKSQKIYGNLFNYAKTEYKGCNHPICIIDKDFGEVWTTPTQHLSSKYGHKLRAYKIRELKHRSNTKEFIKKARQKYGDFYDYSEVKYITCDSEIIVGDPKYGKFKTTPTKHLTGCQHPARRGQISRIGLSWLLSLPNSNEFIKPFEEPRLSFNGRTRFVDGYNLETNTVYQFHGKHWHGWDGINIIDEKRYIDTLKKDQEIRDSGYNLVVMWEHDWRKTVTREDWDRVPIQGQNSKSKLKFPPILSN